MRIGLMESGMTLRGSGLAALLPPALLRLLGLERQRLLLDLQDDAVILRRQRGNDPPGGTESLPLADAAKIASQPCDEIVLRLDSGTVLAKEIALPAKAADSLSAIIPFELERLSPLPPEQLAYDFLPLEKKAGSLRVLLQLAPRQSLRDAVQALGFTPDRVIGGGDPLPLQAGLNLLPLGERAPPRRSWATRLAWALALLGLLAAIAAPFAQLHAQRQAVLSEISALKQQLAAKTAADPRQAERLTALTAARAQYGSAALLLEEMSKLLPDEVWLTQWNLSEGQLEIEGLAQAAAPLVGLIEASPVFGRVRFLTPLTRDPLRGRERFHFAIQIKPAPRTISGAAP